jgi:putative glutathione S-transferase
VSRQRVQSEPKCLADFPAPTGFVEHVYNDPGVAETVHFDHILAHYFDSDWSTPPRRGIVPNLPEPAWYMSHRG